MSEIILVIDDESGVCVNAIVLGPGWTPPAGHRAVAPTGAAWIGWTLNDDGSWTPPPEQQP